MMLSQADPPPVNIAYYQFRLEDGDVFISLFLFLFLIGGVMKMRYYDMLIEISLSVFLFYVALPIYEYLDTLLTNWNFDYFYGLVRYSKTAHGVIHIPSVFLGTWLLGSIIIGRAVAPQLKSYVFERVRLYQGVNAVTVDEK